MKRNPLFIFSLFLLAFAGRLSAQELNCQVQVLSPQIQGTTEKRIFENLQKAIFEYMNNTKWTNDVFSPEERIQCNFVLTISEKISSDDYKGNIQVLSQRPVFKSSYNSVLLNHNDQDVQFKYVEFQPLEFSINQHMSNLTSLLSYYAYVVIALDYDTYSPNGGTPFWQKAQTIVNNAQNAPERGWKSMESTKNRYWLVDNMLQPIFAPIRECMYKYHRLGMDVMFQDVAGGRIACLEALSGLEKIHNQRPLSFPMQVFFNAKSKEVTEIFKGGMPEEKTKAATLLQKIDPGHAIDYQKITQQQ